MSLPDIEDPTPVGKKPRQQEWPSKRPYLAINVKRFIEERNTTARDVVEVAGLGPTFITDIYKGRGRNPTLDKLEALASALGTDVRSLLEENEPSIQGGKAKGDSQRISYNLQTQIPVVGMAETEAYRVTTEAVLRVIQGPLHPKFPHAKARALEIRDVAMDAAKPTPLIIGFDALYIDMRAESLVVESGNIYAIRRSRDRNARPPRIDETLIRRAQVFADRVELSAETNYRGAGSFEKIIVPGKLTTDPDHQVYAFGLVYGVVALCYQI